MHMDFRSATDELLEHPTLQDLAAALRVSVQSIRQARTDVESTAYREPPPEWERGVLSLAEKAATHYQRLAKKLRKTAL
jgi:hypothetical protein